MERIRPRDFLLGVIAGCLLLITARLYDTVLVGRAHAAQQVEEARPMPVVIVGQKDILKVGTGFDALRVETISGKPLQVEQFRRQGAGYAAVFDQQGRSAIPVEVMGRSGDSLVPVGVNGFGAALHVR